MKVVIFGGCGFIGKNVALGFASQGRKVLVVDKFKDTSGILQKHNIGFQECDFLSERNYGRYLDDGDLVIHLISTSVPGTSNMDIVADARNNIIPTLELIKVCGEKKVSKIIYSSSGGQVYGIPQEVPITEGHVTAPRSAYGVHKLAIEKYLMLCEVLYGVKVGILRIANPYGPGQRPYTGQGIIPTYLASAMQGKSVEVWGDGSSVRDYLYIDDLVDAFLKVSDYCGERHVFNVGSAKGYSINQIVEVVERTTHRSLNLEYIPIKTFDVKANILNCEKAKRELDWYAKVNLEEGLSRMVKNWDEKAQSFLIDRE